MAFKLNGKPLPLDTAFTTGGFNYGANWLRHATLEEKKAIGITEVADDPRYNNSFYKSYNVAKDLAGLKTQFITEQKNIANSLLALYDWQVTRKAEKNIDIDAKIVTYRDSIRSVCTTRENEITACKDVPALETLMTSTITAWPIDPYNVVDNPGDGKG